MKQHTREYFVSRVRSGLYIVKHAGLRLIIRPHDIEQELESNLVYQEAYEEASEDGIMTEDEMEEWMLEKGLWSKEEDNVIKGVKKDIDKLRVQMYENRNKDDVREAARKYLRAAERALVERLQKKTQFIANTCEGFAKTEQHRWLVQNSTYCNGDRFKFSDVILDEIISLQQQQVLSEKEIRELARNEPWRSIWALNDKVKFELFSNADKELTVDQKNLVVWSMMYDNIQEAAETPSEDVINDDDVLDGWFIVQRKKREVESAQNDFENSTQNERIKGAGEVFVFANNQKEAEKVDGMNSTHAKIVKRQRNAQIRASSGQVGQDQFRDEQLKMTTKQNQMFKDKFKR